MNLFDNFCQYYFLGVGDPAEQNSMLPGIWDNDDIKSSIFIILKSSFISSKHLNIF